MENYDNGIIGIMTGMIIFFIFYMVFFVALIVALWKIFEKAGKPGWAAIIPVYNSIVLLEITGKPIWWIFLFFIPFVNLVFAIIVYHSLSLSFGQGAGTTVLIFVFGIGLFMLGFGNAKYIGPIKS